MYMEWLVSIAAWITVVQHTQQKTEFLKITVSSYSEQNARMATTEIS